MIPARWLIKTKLYQSGHWYAWAVNGRSSARCVLTEPDDLTVYFCRGATRVEAMDGLWAEHPETKEGLVVG